MKLENKIRSDLRNKKLARPPAQLQGVTKTCIRQVLRALARETEDQIDVVFALLDDQTSSWFSEAAGKGMKFSAGASTAHIACHVGLVQRTSGKLDREGRDYWLKPLWEIGALEKIYFDPDEGEFLTGHPIAKSPNSSYRIAASFLEVLRAPDADRPALLAAWMSEDATRARLKVQAELAKAACVGIENPHKNLIAAATEVYVPRFLPGFDVLYVDAGDGDRVTDQDRETLRKAGLYIKLGDSMPDVLLWNKQTDALWVIEAVTSDGEVDLHKVESLTAFAQRHGKKSIGFTTAYATWKDAAARQGRHKNIAPGTAIWIQEDGAKQFTVETFEWSRQRLHQ
jgi:hypothetical protein